MKESFTPVGAVGERDLSGCPTDQQSTTTRIAKIDEDYTKSPPAPPELPGAADEVSNININNTFIDDMVGELNKNLDKQYKKNLDKYRMTEDTGELSTIWNGLKSSRQIEKIYYLDILNVY